MTHYVRSTLLQQYLPLLASGKVRDVYTLNQSELLLVTTDRISGVHSCHFYACHMLIEGSAFDVVMKNPFTQRGAVLNQMSAFWFEKLQEILRKSEPTCGSHFKHLGIPDELRQRLRTDHHEDLLAWLESRSMVVKKLTMVPIESIVRGYVTGSAWASYQKDGTILGRKTSTGLVESQKLEKALWTPSTKAPVGERDESITPEEG